MLCSLHELIFYGLQSMCTGGVGRKIRGLDNTFWSKKGLTKITSVSGSKQQNGVCENCGQSWWALGQTASVGACSKRIQ
jgi:hypothetical protein